MAAESEAECRYKKWVAINEQLEICAGVHVVFSERSQRFKRKIGLESSGEYIVDGENWQLKSTRGCSYHWCGQKTWLETASG